MIEYIDTTATAPDVPYQRFVPGPHKGELNPQQQLCADNTGDITTLTIISTNLIEAQHSTIQFHTGRWKSVPQLYSLDPGLDFLVLSTTQGIVYFQIKGTQIKMSKKVPVDVIANRLITTQPVALTAIEAMPVSPVPTQATEAEDLHTAAIAPPHKKFCTQCGAPFKPADKFCAYCGNSLKP